MITMAAIAIGRQKDRALKCAVNIFFIPLTPFP
jgi:hypothetical protein